MTLFHSRRSVLEQSTYEKPLENRTVLKWFPDNKFFVYLILELVELLPPFITLLLLLLYSILILSSTTSFNFEYNFNFHNYLLHCKHFFPAFHLLFPVFFSFHFIFFSSLFVSSYRCSIVIKKCQL